MRQWGGHRWLWCAFLCLCVGMGGTLSSAIADDAAPALAPPLTLQLTIDAVLQRNPALRESRERHQAALHRVPQATALDDPMLGVEMKGIRSGTYSDVGYSASQMWPFPGKRRLRGRIAARAADMIAVDTEALTRDLIAQTKTAYFALYLVERSLEINRHNRQLLEQAERVAESKYASGTSSMQDVLKAQVELAKLSNELIGLQQERAVAIARLNALMDREPATPIVIASSARAAALTATLDELEQRMLSSRPELRAATLAIERDQSALALAKLDYLPDLTTKVEARQYRGGAPSEVDTMFAVNVPLWFGKQRAHVQETRAALAADQAAHVRVKNEAFFALRDAYARVTAAQQSAKLYETSVLPQAEQSLKVAQAGYEAARVSFLDLLDAERSWKTFQLQYQQALVTHETAWADLERAVGVSLDDTREPASLHTEVTQP